MAKLNKDLQRILEFELTHYHEYNMRLAAMRTRSNLLGLSQPPVTSMYIHRIEFVCAAIERTLDKLPKEQRDMIHHVYLHRADTLKRFATTNYMDISTAYRWKNNFFQDLAAELGYL